MSDPLDDAQNDLIQRALAGDESALAALFDGYRDRLRKMIRLRLDRRLSGRVDSSDVLQEAYLDVRRLEQAVEARGGVGASHPDEWTFLAMTHHRLGHRDEAQRWLERLREHRPKEDADRFWEELGIRLLRAEA